MIIVFEGPDKLGKTTQAKLLAEKLNCKYIKFPNEEMYSGKIIRKILNKELPFEPASFQALQIINRIETFEKLDLKETYVFDRGTLSGIVYGLADGLPEDWIRKVCSYIPAPDITFVFRGMPYQTDSDIYSSTDYQEKIKDLYWEEARKISGKMFFIGSRGNESQVHENIMSCLKGVL